MLPNSTRAFLAAVVLYDSFVAAGGELRARTNATSIFIRHVRPSATTYSSEMVKLGNGEGNRLSAVTRAIGQAIETRVSA